MDRYVKYVFATFLAVLTSVTVLIALGHSAEVEQFGAVVAQGVGSLLTFYLIQRSGRQTREDVEAKGEQVKSEVKEEVRSEVRAAVENGGFSGPHRPVL